MSENPLPGKPDPDNEEREIDNEDQSAIVPIDPSPLDDLNTEELIDWLENHPERGQRLLATFSRFFSGPLPPPDLLKDYDDAVAGSAKLIIDQFTEQGNHRRKIEMMVISGDEKRANWGMIAAFFLASICVAGSLFTLNNRDNVAAGLGALFLSFVPLITAFLTATYRRQKERNEKDAINPE